MNNSITINILNLLGKPMEINDAFLVFLARIRQTTRFFVGFAVCIGYGAACFGLFQQRIQNLNGSLFCSLIHCLLSSNNFLSNQKKYKFLIYRHLHFFKTC